MNTPVANKAISELNEQAQHSLAGPAVTTFTVKCRLTTNANYGTNRWKYGYEQVVFNTATDDHDLVAGGITGTPTTNYAVNSFEKSISSGVLPNGVDLADVAAVGGTWALVPLGPGGVVDMTFHAVPGGGWRGEFTIPNSFGGGC